jgi:flagellar export protein FliJ
VAFRFRAQAALDLRTRELETAQRQLVRAEGDRDFARRRLGEADGALADARAKASAVQLTATDCTTLQWYQSWILRLHHERIACRTKLAAREGAVVKAIAVCQEARQKRESLARFRQKARDRHDAAEAASERKLIDELATRRFAATRYSAKESASSIGSGVVAKAT